MSSGLTGTETDVAIQGTVQLTGEQALICGHAGRFNLKLLQAFNPNLIANGPATFTVNIAGNGARPQLSGKTRTHGRICFLP